MADENGETSAKSSVKCFSRYLLVVSEYVRAIDVDVGSFLDAFVAKDPALKTETFSDLWHELKMATIFANISTATEAVEFAERLLAVTKNYFLPPKSMKMRTAAVFLLRAFFITQPVARGAHIVLTAGAELKAVEEHVKWMMEKEMTDALVILASLVRMGGFFYSLEPYPREPEHYKEYLMEAGDRVLDESIPEELAEETKAAAELEDALKEFASLSEKYANVTKLIAERLGPERTKVVFPLGTDKIRIPIFGDEDDVDEEGAACGEGRARDLKERVEQAQSVQRRKEQGESILERRNRLRAKAFGLPSNSQ